MTNASTMNNSKLTADWQKYDGDYEKRVQDIKLFSGIVYKECWPNAGEWIVLSLPSNPRIPNKEVEFVKLNKEELP